MISTPFIHPPSPSSSSTAPTTKPPPLIMASITDSNKLFNRPSVWVQGPLIVGAGPSGLAVGACLKDQGVPFVILERSDCIASLWQKRTYDRLKLHLPKKFCQLPNLPFPSDFPEYPSRNQFISYLESYATHFDIHPRFNHAVQSARFDSATGMWHVRADVAGAGEDVEYLCQWLVVATGENSEAVVPEFVGMEEYCAGSPDRAVQHASEYKSGEPYHGKRVLVVGCGNTGMEVCLDLCHYHAFPSMVVRESVHVLPRDVFGMSVFAMAASLTRWLPLRVVDRILLAMARMVMGDVEEYGLRRPSVGPLELKNIEGKTPVLDIGALEKIRSGEIKVVPGIKRFSAGKVELVDGRIIDVDAVILATGYRSNVPSWLQGCDFFSRDGYPKVPFPNGWKGKSGLYAVGFTKRGLSGASMDSVRIAEDIGIVWREVTRLTGCHRRCTSQI